MKGLLLKEFYVWLRTRSWIMIYCISICALVLYTGNSISYVVLGVLIGSISNSIQLDEKSGWLNYYKALPYSPAQRVSAKYIAVTSEFMFAVTASVVASVISQKYFDYSAVKPTDEMLISQAVLTVIISLLLLAIQLPINFKFTGTKRTVISMPPLIMYIVPLVLINNQSILDIMGGGNWLSKTIADEKWFPVAMILVAMLIFGVSWMITILIESNKDKLYRKKFGISAVALSITTVMLSIITAGALYTSGSLPDPSFGGDVSMAKVKEVKEEFYPYYDFFCDELNLGKTPEECKEILEGIGFEEIKGKSYEFHSDSTNIFVSFTLNPESGLIQSIRASSQINEKQIRKASDSDFEAISGNFTVGMSEKELHQKIKELDTIPAQIYERYYTENQPQRCYSFKFATDAYNGNADNPVVYSVSVETAHGTVTDIKTSVYQSSPFNSYLEENPVDVQIKAREEMRSLIDGFCNENHLDSPWEESAYVLESLGYIRNSTESSTLRSASGGIRANIVTEEETGLTDFIYISSGVGEFLIEHATTDDLNKISESFAVGMSEEELHQKFYELEVLPHEILESVNYEKKHLRNYEIVYTVGSYNGGEGTEFEINIDVIDGKVYDVRSYDG